MLAGKLPNLSLGFIKGMGRVTSAVQIVLVCDELGLDMEVMHPTLWNSLRTITAHALKMENRVAECVKNMQLSTKGSIRQETNLIQMAFIVKTLVEENALADVSTFVRMLVDIM